MSEDPADHGEDSALAREHEARLLAEASERRAEFLSNVSAMLSSSLDLEVTLQQVARLAVPTVADVSGVYLLQPDGTLQQLAAAHVDPAKEPLLWELVELIPIHVAQDRVLCRAVRDRRAELVTDVTHVARGRWSPSTRAEEIVATLGLRSYIAAPLVIRDQVLGAIAFSAAESGRAFDERDLRLADEIARRAAVAIENARLHRDVEKAVRARDEFLSVASHELNTPLTSLLLQIETLERKNVPAERYAEKLAKIGHQARRMAGLVRQLLDVSRIVDGRLVLEPEVVDLGQLTAEVVERFREDAPASSILTLQAATGVLGEWDRFRLDQVVSNLVGNAVKYGEGKPIDVIVSKGEERDDGYAELVVRDHGIGIEPAEQARIFERFERAVSGRRFTGFGLGLWIARQFIEASGGTIRVESAASIGSTFTVRLPRRRGAAPRIERP